MLNVLVLVVLSLALLPIGAVSTANVSTGDVVYVEVQTAKEKPILVVDPYYQPGSPEAIKVLQDLKDVALGNMPADVFVVVEIDKKGKRVRPGIPEDPGITEGPPEDARERIDSFVQAIVSVVQARAGDVVRFVDALVSRVPLEILVQQPTGMPVLVEQLRPGNWS